LQRPRIEETKDLISSFITDGKVTQGGKLRTVHPLLMVPPELTVQRIFILFKIINKFKVVSDCIVL